MVMFTVPFSVFVISSGVIPLNFKLASAEAFPEIVFEGIPRNFTAKVSELISLPCTDISTAPFIRL